LLFEKSFVYLFDALINDMECLRLISAWWFAETSSRRA